MSLVDIAINSVGNKPVSLSEISSRQIYPYLFRANFYFSKKSGIVKSVRGPLVVIHLQKTLISLRFMML